MCGIVGYIGFKEAQNLLLEGLSKLEYRGYDSAGLAVYNGETIGVQKNEGRLTNLEEKLRAKSLPGTLGIGHTRWATHGSLQIKTPIPTRTKRVVLRWFITGLSKTTLN